MNVALPEVDGRVLTRAVAFKSEARFDDATQTTVVKHLPSSDRIEFAIDLAASWVDLAGMRVAERRIAVVLANYPNRDGRVGNGVGLDTPAGTINLLRALEDAGYLVNDPPTDGNALVDRLLSGPTNMETRGRRVEESISGRLSRLFFQPTEIHA